MTYEEAIYQISNYGLDDEGSPPELLEAARLFRSACEKQIPKKPIEEKNSVLDWCQNPDCKHGVWNPEPFCKECGQAIDWGDQNGKIH